MLKRLWWSLLKCVTKCILWLLVFKCDPIGCLQVFIIAVDELVGLIFGSGWGARRHTLAKFRGRSLIQTRLKRLMHLHIVSIVLEHHLGGLLMLTFRWSPLTKAESVITYITMIRCDGLQWLRGLWGLKDIPVIHIVFLRALKMGLGHDMRVFVCLRYFEVNL